MVLPPWKIRSCDGDGLRPPAIASDNGKPAWERNALSAGDPCLKETFNGRRAFGFIVISLPSEQRISRRIAPDRAPRSTLAGTYVTRLWPNVLFHNDIFLQIDTFRLRQSKVRDDYPNNIVRIGHARDEASKVSARILTCRSPRILFEILQVNGRVVKNDKTQPFQGRT